MRVGITYDLRDDYLAQGWSQEETAEFDKRETIQALHDTIASCGHEPDDIGNLWNLVARLAAGSRWDLVFNIAEGLSGYGRESAVPALLEGYSIPYTFSDPLVLAVALHKGMTKRLMHIAGIPTPAFAEVGQIEDVAKIDLPYPLFAKPVAEGTGKGINSSSKISNPEQLQATCRALLARFRQPVLVETFLPGREFTVGLLGQGSTTRSLGVMEVLFHEPTDQAIYGQITKEDYERRVAYRLVQDEEAKRAAEVARAAWRSLGCRDAGRVDLRSDASGQPQFIEVNPLAGINPKHSDLPILCRLAGIEYRWLIDQILDMAAQRASQEPRRSAEFGVGPTR